MSLFTNSNVSFLNKIKDHFFSILNNDCNLYSINLNYCHCLQTQMCLNKINVTIYREKYFDCLAFCIRHNHIANLNFI